MAMARVMEPFKDLARCGATVVILHHRGKSSEAEFRGAEDIVGAVDVAYSLVRDEDSRHQVTLKQIKNRFAPESSQSLVLINGVFQRAVT